MTDHPWLVEYRRKVLEHLAAPVDVDLSTVSIEPSYSEYDDYEWIHTDDGPEEHSIERISFEITVTWLHHVPQFDGQNPEPGVPGETPQYQHTRTLENQEVADLLIHLTT